LSIKVWAMGAGGLWSCERTLLGHKGHILSLAQWQDKLVSGSVDRRVRVWDVGTGAHVATLAGLAGPVRGLAAHGDRLFGASHDGKIWEWAFGTWASLRTVTVDAGGPDREVGVHPHCLAVSGSQLVSGSVGWYGEVRVWSLKSLDLQHTPLQPAEAEVWALLAVEGGVWAGVGRDVVWWGRRGA
jgi:WD40 repeat protein